jgi:site-specific recombinase XerD
MAQGTRLKYGAHVRHFLNWLGDRDPATVTRQDIEDYLDAWHAADGPAPGTIRVRLSALKSFYTYLEDRGQVDRNPVLRVKPPKSPKKPIQWLRQDEDNAVLECATTDIEAIIVWLHRWTGLRVGEATALLIRDVDLEAGTIRVRKSKSNSGLRTIPIAPELDLELRRWLHTLQRRGLYRPDAPLLCTAHGTPMASQFVWRVVKRVGERAEVKISPHTLRRTFASHLLNKGARIEVVSKLLGHSDVRVTQAAYAELEDATTRAEFLRVLEA